MKKPILSVALLSLLAVGVLAGCSTTSPDVSGTIRTALDQAGYKDVTVVQDRDRGVVTLGGHVVSDNAKLQADALAKGIAAPQIIADNIVVTPAKP